MAEWFYRKNDQQHGPVDMATLRHMAHNGEIGPADLIWREGLTNWVVASQAKGLFPAPAGTAQPEPVGAAAPAQQVAVAVVPPPPPMSHPGQINLQYASPIPPRYQSPRAPVQAALRPLSPVPFSCVAAVMLALGLILVFQAYFVSPTAKQVPLSILITCGFLLLCVPALVLWLAWIDRIHTTLRSLSSGYYSVSPAQAVGFSFIPLFDAFWAIYMPWRACEELNRHLLARGLAPVSSGLVMVCQIVSVLVALPMPGLLPACYAATMWQINAGMNRLLANQGIHNHHHADAIAN